MGVVRSPGAQWVKGMRDMGMKAGALHREEALRAEWAPVPDQLSSGVTSTLALAPPQADSEPKEKPQRLRRLSARSGC